MNFFKTAVVVVLCVSLLFNLFLLNKIDEVNNRINAFNNSQHQMINTVNAQISQLNNSINELKDDQDWLSNMNFEVEVNEAEKNEAVTNFEWQIKELQKDAEVVFNYKRSAEKEYTSVKPVNMGNGLFKVAVPVEVNPEPIWNYRVNVFNDSSKEYAIKESMEEYKRGNQLTFDYYVSVSQGDVIKSNEISTSHLENVGARYYGYLEVYTDINRNDNYSVFLTSGKMNYNTVHLEEVHLIKYKDGELIESEKLEPISTIQEGETPAKSDIVEFHKKLSDEKFDYSSLKLRVIYSDGSEFEREIYTE